MLRALMMISCVLVLGVANVGCVVINPNDGGGDNDKDDEDDDDDDDDREPNPDLCSASNPCPTGQFCFNGFCALGCTNDDNCDPDSYCNVNHCAPSEVPTCGGNDDCADGFVCALDYCAVVPVEPKGCQWNESLQDGCPSNEICLGDDPDNDVDGECSQFPACPEDGDCPVGEAGAVCNEGYISTKDRICLVGLCAVQADCPSNLRCVLVAGELGFCSVPGPQGSPCSVDDDCADGLTCDAFAPGLPSICGGDGGGGGGGGEEGDLCDVDDDCAAELTCEGAEGGFPGFCE